MAIINFTCKISKAGTNTDPNTTKLGLNRDLLNKLNFNIPLITPRTGGVITYYNSNGTLSDLNGYGGTAIENICFWMPSRLIDATSKAIGPWAENLLPVGTTITGTVFGEIP